jgi:hypothetical protein
VVHAVDGLQAVHDAASFLAWQRAKYGAELFIPWNLRDRGADAFHAYLEEWRHQYTGAT